MRFGYVRLVGNTKITRHHVNCSAASETVEEGVSTNRNFRSQQSGGASQQAQYLQPNSGQAARKGCLFFGVCGCCI
jgi:hypothetical protein